ncbi:hypothetical protein EYF80_016042 [Liparis tanakae]|uniref:Uncharacterized protein n=1 Tax=Liparis tanakae TaxID=230148 RepID=A0A4Z2I8F9_9TELE|nr:hypothetical protein EYF80_016042 [Liparis tanakae]
MGMNGAPGPCAAGKGLLREPELLRQGSQPEVLRVSNEQHSAPWDNNMKSCVAVGKHLATVRGAEQEVEMQCRQMCCRFFGLWGGLEAHSNPTQRHLLRRTVKPHPVLAN